MLRSRSYQIVPEIEKYFKEVSYRESISLSGSYDPKAMELSEADFLDGMPPKSHALKKILR